MMHPNPFRLNISWKDQHVAFYGLRYAKTSLMAQVVVIPKEGRVCPSFFWYDTDALDLFFEVFFPFFEKSVWYDFLDFFIIFFFNYFWKVGVIPNEGWVWPSTPVLFLVWHRLRSWGTFSRNAAHVAFYVTICQCRDQWDLLHVHSTIFMTRFIRTMYVTQLTMYKIGYKDVSRTASGVW